MLNWTIETLVMAGVLGICSIVICRLQDRKPAFCHFLWVLVVARLMMPTISMENWPPAKICETLSENISTLQSNAQSLFSPRALGRQEPGSDHSLRQGSSTSNRPEPEGSTSSRPAFYPPYPEDTYLTTEDQRDREDDSALGLTPVVESVFDDGESGMAASLPTLVTESSEAAPAPGMIQRASEIYAAKEAESKNSSSWKESAEEEADAKMAKKSETEMDSEEIVYAAPDLGALPTTPMIVKAELGVGARFWNWLTMPTTMLVLLILVWLTGCIGVLVHHVRGVRAFRRAIAGGMDAPEELELIVADVAGRMGLEAPPTRILENLPTPVVWCLRKPVLLWPASMNSRAEIRDSRGIVAHELAHLCRRDHWVSWLEMAVSVVWWWNPLMWFALGKVRYYADLACDAHVVRVFPDDRRRYAESLIDVVQRMTERKSFLQRLPNAIRGKAQVPALALGLGDTARNNFERRIRMIAREKTFCRISPMLGVAAIAMTALLLPSWAGGTILDDVGVSSAVRPAGINARLQRVIDVRKAEQRAWQCAKSKDVEGAIQEFEFVVSAEPENGGAWDKLGYLYMEQDRIEDALGAFRAQAETDGDVAKAYYNVACMEALLGHEGKALKALGQALANGNSSGEYARSDSDLESLFENKRFVKMTEQMDELTKLEKKAGNAIEEKDFIAAATAWGALTERAPKVGKYQHMLSYSLIGAGELDGAAAAIEKQLALDYSVGTALYNMACIRSLEGNQDDAVKYLAKSVAHGFGDRDLLKNDPDLTNIRETSGYAKIAQSLNDAARRRAEANLAMEFEDWDQAVNLYSQIVDDEQGLKNKKGSSWAQRQLGIARFYMGEYDQAEASFVASVESGQSMADGLYNIACCRGQVGDVGGGLEHLQASVELGFDNSAQMYADEDLGVLRDAPEFGRIANYAADQKVLEGFGAASWEDLKEQSLENIADNAENGGAHLKLGWAYLREGNLEDARKAFVKQGKLGHMSGIAWYNVACCYAMGDDVDSAFEWLERAMDERAVSVDHMKTDPDIASLREDARFGKLVKAYQAKYPAMKKTEKADHASDSSDSDKKKKSESWSKDEAKKMKAKKSKQAKDADWDDNNN